MAAPSYTTDLTTIAIGSIGVDTGTWDESSDAGWDTAGTMVDDANLYYNGTACVSAQYTKNGTGTGASGPGTIMYVHPTSFTIPLDGAVLIHHLWAAPAALNALVPGAGEAGITMLVGNSFGDCDIWNMSGSDFAPAPRGGWANYAVNPTVTRDTLIGAGAASPYTTAGVGVAATAQARGNPQACNAIRYGRCEAIFTDGDLANGYATFAGYGLVDNASATRWNLIEPIGTSGFTVQGLQSLGTAATAVDFRDENKNISVKDTINVTAGFNRMNVTNVSSNVEWTAVSIASLGTVSKWSFEAIDNAVISKTACTFTDDDTFIYQSNSTLTSTTYRRCGQVTQGGAVFTGCTFDRSGATTALLVSDLALITGNIFNSDGTGHAVDIGTVAATTSLSWDNTLNSLTTEWDGITGTTVGISGTVNDAILVNVAAGQTLTISVQTGASIPTIQNTGTGTVTISAGLITVAVTVKDASDGALLPGAKVYLIDDATKAVIYLNGETTASGVVSTSISYTADVAVVGWVRQWDLLGDDYIAQNISGTITSTGFSTTVSLQPI